MGECLRISEGTFPENGRLQRHFFKSLNFDANQLSRGRKMSLEQAHLMDPGAKPSESF